MEPVSATIPVYLKTENISVIFLKNPPKQPYVASITNRVLSRCSARDWDGKDYLRIIPRVVLVEDPRLT